MQLKIIGSNSQGNCYILENDTHALVLECGVRFSEVKKALDFNIRKIVGALLTHEHKDHSFSVKDVLAAAIPVYTTKGTAEACGITSSAWYMPVAYGKQFTIGDFKILPVKTYHDAAEPCGFLINHPDCGTVLFLTDTIYCDYTFRGLNHVIIEANYCQRIIDDKVAAGSVQDFLRDRVIRSHMSLDTCKKTLAANNLSAVKNIVLIHLSNSNSDALRFKKEVAATTGKPVHIAEAGMKINLTTQPF